MGIIGDVVGSIIGGGSQSSGGTGAYTGGGTFGMGSFLSGVAQAYETIKQETGITDKRLTDAQRIKLDSMLDTALCEYRSCNFTKSQAWVDAESYLSGTFNKAKSEALTIFKHEWTSGMYRCSASQDTVNDIYGKYAFEAAKLRHQIVTDYQKARIEQGQLIVGAFARYIESQLQRNENLSKETKPDIKQFMEDSAKLQVIMALLDLLGGSGSGSSKGIGGLIGSVIGNFI